MSLESDVQTLLSAVGSAFQDVAPQGSVAPYMVWSLIISTTNNSMQGASNRQNTRIQVDAYAKTQADRKTLADAVVAAFAASLISNVQLSAQNLYEADVKLFRTTLDFSVWSL